MNEVAEAALDAVCRCLLNVPGGVLSVQPAVDAPGAAVEVPTLNERSDGHIRAVGIGAGISCAPQIFDRG